MKEPRPRPLIRGLMDFSRTARQELKVEERSMSWYLRFCGNHESYVETVKQRRLKVSLLREDYILREELVNLAVKIYGHGWCS